MRHIPIHVLAPGDATDGQVPTWDAAANEVVWADGSVTGGMPAGGAAGQVLTKLSATDYDAGWATPSGGGGGGGAGRDVRWTCPSTMTTIDEFNDDTLSGSWAQVNPAGATAANAEWTELADVLSVGTLGGDSTGAIRAQIRPVGTAMAVGDAFVTCETLQAPNSLYTMGGLVLSNTDTVGGNQMALIAYRGTTFAVGSWGFASWAGGSAIVGNTHSANSITDGMALHMRLVYMGGTTWRADISSDGVTWRKSSTFTKASFIPTHVGVLASSWGSATQGVISYDYLRRQAGIA